MLVPASSFASYEWGSINDEPLQPLATTPWTVRNAIPLAPAGNIRALDAIESRFTDVRGSRALADYLANSGVGLLVVRNDLQGMVDGLDPEAVYSTLRDTPGVERVAGFGPVIGGDARIESENGAPLFIDQGWQAEHQAVEIYRVWGSALVRAQPASTVPVVIGSPDTQLALMEGGLLRSPSVIFAQDADADSRPNELILTDGQRRQEAAFGRSHSNRSNSLTAEDSYVANRPVHDYAMSEGNRWFSVPEFEGAKKITASSAGSWVNTSTSIDKSQQPWSAFDGDPLTAWTASTDDIGKRSWIEIEFDESVDLSGASVTVNRDPIKTVRLSVETDNETTNMRARGNTPTSLQGLSGRTKTLRISGVSAANDLLSITDVEIPHAALARPLVLPEPRLGWGSPQRILLSADDGYRSGCLDVNGYLRCASAEDGWGEDGRTLDRVFTLPETQRYPVQLTAEPIGGAAIDRLMQTDELIDISSSSQTVRSARASAVNATDGDLKTAWVADADDANPRLTVNWVGERKIATITTRVTKETAASRPAQVTLVFADGSKQQVILSAEGVGRFTPVTTDRVEIRFDKSRNIDNLNSNGSGGRLPVGVSEVTIGDTDLLPHAISADERDFKCGSGPDVRIDGQIYESAVSASPMQLRSGEELEAQICDLDSTVLDSGTHRVTVRGSSAFRPVRLAFGERPDNAPEETSVQIRKWEPIERALDFTKPADGQLLTVTENFNRGWTESRGKGHAMVVNGWQQGWSFSGDAGTEIGLKYEPNVDHRRGLAVGAASLLLLVLLCGVLWFKGRSFGIPVHTRRSPRIVGLLSVTVTAAALVTLGGVSGLVLGGIGAIVGMAFHKRVDVSALAGIVVALVGFASALRPWAGASAWFGAMVWPQLAIAFALGLMAVSVFGWKSRLSPFTGRSTKR